MSTVRKGKPREGTAAAERQRVIDALGMANLGSVDLMKVRTKDDADRVIAQFQRRSAGPTQCTTASGTKIHYRRDRFRTLCGFKAIDLTRHAQRAMDSCAMCVNIHEKEDA